MKFKKLKVLAGAFTLTSFVLAGCNSNENEKINNQQAVSENTIDIQNEEINITENRELEKIEEEIYDLECRVEELDDEIEDLKDERSEILQKIDELKEEKQLVEDTHPCVENNESLKYYDDITSDINLNDIFIKSEEDFNYALERIINNRKKVNERSEYEYIDVSIQNLELQNYSEETKQKLNAFLIELGEIDKLEASGLKLEDIEFLSNTSVGYLDLGSNKIKDITVLASVKNLETLRLSDNKITDLTPVSQLTELNNLSIMINNITDLTPLSNLYNLQTLFAGSNNISDLKPLSCLASLHTLFLDNNNITSLDGLERMYSLVRLNLYCNDIQNVDAILPIIERNDVMIYLDSEENAESIAKVRNNNDKIFIKTK